MESYKNQINDTKELARVFNYYSGFLEKDSSINITISKSCKMKSQRQLGFLWGVLFQSMANYSNSINGGNDSAEDIKEDMYKYFVETKERVTLTGKVEQKPILTLSKMSIEQTKEFIDNILFFCDEKKIPLPPKARYLWVSNIAINEWDYIKDRVRKVDKKQAQFICWTREQPCIVCGNYKSQAHHLLGFGLGGTSLKPYDLFSIPLCGDCHIPAAHDKGINWLIGKLKFITDVCELPDFCIANFYRWYNHRG